MRLQVVVIGSTIMITGEIVKPVFIYTRFSLATRDSASAWRASRELSFDDYLQVLFEPKRLETRCNLLLGMTLPLIEIARQAKASLDIRHRIVASDMLPDHVKARLDDAAQRYPWLDVQYMGFDEHWRGKEKFHTFLSGFPSSIGRSPCMVLNLDDDDILSPNYFELLERYHDGKFVGMVFSAPRGYEGLYDDGGFLCFAPIDAPKINIGLAYIASYDFSTRRLLTPRAVVPGSHKSVDTICPVILDGALPSFIRTRHMYNDGAVDKAGYRFNDLEKIRERHFRIEAPVDEVREHFPITL